MSHHIYKSKSTLPPDLASSSPLTPANLPLAEDRFIQTTTTHSSLREAALPENSASASDPASDPASALTSASDSGPTTTAQAWTLTPRSLPSPQASPPVGKWDAEISRRGCGPSAIAPVGKPGQVLPSSEKTTSSTVTPFGRQTEDPALTRVGGPGLRKRSRQEKTVVGPLPSTKRARAGLDHPVHIDLPTPIMDPPPPATDPGEDRKPMSPLFFSHTPRHMTAPLPSFSPSDAAVAMLAKLRDDPNTVTTTVRLPRGTTGSGSLARSVSTSTTNSSGMSSVGTGANATMRRTEARALPPEFRSLQRIAMLELLEQDSRPTLVVDLWNSVHSTSRGLHIIYANPALRVSTGLLRLLTAEGADGAEGHEHNAGVNFARFKSWALAASLPSGDAESRPPFYSYGRVTWSFSTLRKRFRIISAGASSVPTGPESSPEPLILADASQQTQFSREPPEPPDYFGTIDPGLYSGHNVEETPGGGRADPTRTDNEDRLDRHPALQCSGATYDWTRLPVTADMSDHIVFARSVDWASTPLGPIEDWPTDLRIMANMVMVSPHPAAIYWGPEYIAIYNEAYIDLVGKKHPRLMGQSYKDAWAEIWDELEPAFTNAWQSGQATMKHDDRLFVNRDGFIEETFFSWSIMPFVGGGGQVVGLYNPGFEHTRRKVNERWMLTLREVGEKTALARDTRSFWGYVQQGLEFNENDVPFALIYSTMEEGAETETSSSIQSGGSMLSPKIVLEGSLGVPEGHQSAVSHRDLRSSTEGFVPQMRQAMLTLGTVELSDSDGTLPRGMLDGMRWRGFGEVCHTVVVLPIVPAATSESAVGFIVLGVNPRRPYDDDYKLFINLLSRQLTTSMASVTLFEEEIRRGQKAASQARRETQELSAQLQIRTQEALHLEYKFTRMTEFAPVGIFIADPDGTVTYCNNKWWEISQHPRTVDNVKTWMGSVNEEDLPQVQAVWKRLVEEEQPISLEFRFKAPCRRGDQVMDTWALMGGHPERGPQGDVMLIFGSITDISSQKWAEGFEKQQREEAVEMKRQQENFIDITSHEMRNPLSAVLQCADEILNGITTFQQQQQQRQLVDKSTTRLDGLLDECIEAANTISLCASHQKRIVDDILTLSKLDSQLLMVTPVDVQPVTVTRRVLKMFEPELNTHKIKLDFNVEPSYGALGVDWVKLDPSRLQQVLINLMTNAIKFTQNRETRRVRIGLGASRDPSEVDVAYFPSRRPDQGGITDGSDWGRGDVINLHFSVSDTGPGLDEDELKMLFRRFSQATPRTHVRYGGSGLGLFISRILTELQGGQIGVVSSKGTGSTFVFYVKSRKTEMAATAAATTTTTTTTMMTKTTTTTATTTLSPQPSSLLTSLSSRSLSSPTLRQPSLPRTPSQAGPGALALDVLIVEDNVVNQKVLQRQLRNCGNNTHVANHGGEALDQLRASRFWAGRELDGVAIHVVLMDLEMPVMDGMTCARKIRKLEAEGVIVRHIPIIAVTAYARPEQIASAKAAGIDDVISKPFRIPDLMPKIEELLSRFGAGA